MTPEKVAMENYRCFKCLISIVILFLVVSCKTTNLPSIGSGEKPFQVEDDEKKVWQYAEQLERLLDQRGILYKDPSLEAFLNAGTPRPEGNMRGHSPIVAG